MIGAIMVWDSTKSGAYPSIGQAGQSHGSCINARDLPPLPSSWLKGLAKTATRALGLAITWAALSAGSLPPEFSVDEKTGLVVVGPWGQRRAYLPLDAARIPRIYRGTWTVVHEPCSDAAPQLGSAARTANGTLVIEGDQLLTRKGLLRVTGIYGHAPKSITPAMISRGRPIRLATARFARGPEILIVYAQEGAVEMGYAQLFLSERAQVLTFRTSRSRDEMKRC